MYKRRKIEDNPYPSLSQRVDISLVSSKYDINDLIQDRQKVWSANQVINGTANQMRELRLSVATFRVGDEPTAVVIQHILKTDSRFCELYEWCWTAEVLNLSNDYTDSKFYMLWVRKKID